MSEDSEAQKLLDQRRAVYGDRVENMRRVALMWSGFLGVTIEPWQVPVMFSLYKMYRIGITPDYSDNVDDVDGYMLMFREVMGDDMIQARTVEEYQERKGFREIEVPEESDDFDILEEIREAAYRFYPGPDSEALSEEGFEELNQRRQWFIHGAYAARDGLSKVVLVNNLLPPALRSTLESIWNKGYDWWVGSHFTTR